MKFFPFILLFSISCAHDARKDPLTFKNLFRNKPNKVKTVNFDPIDNIDTEKSEIKFYAPYEKFIADEGVSYGVKVKLVSKTGTLLNIDPKMINLHGLPKDNWEIFRIKPGEYLITGLSSRNEGSFKIFAYIGPFQLSQHLDVKFIAPFSSANSEWNLVAKPESHIRIYQLVLKNLKGEIIKDAPNPEIIVEGEAVTETVLKESYYYLVKMRFDCEDCAVYFGFKIYGQTVSRFQRINFKAIKIDEHKSYIYASKLNVRADGQDFGRVYFRLLNDVGYVLYQTKDFVMNLISNRKSDIIEGPLEGNIGVYFKVKSKAPGTSILKLWVDNTRIASEVEMDFLKPQKYTLTLRNNCLQELMKQEPFSLTENDIELISDHPDYDRAWSKLKRVYLEKSSGNFDEFFQYASILSNPACVMTPDFDTLREASVHELHRITRNKMK